MTQIMHPNTVVLQILARYSDRPQSAIMAEDRLAEDLKMDGDDFGMSVVPQIQAALDFKAPKSEWENVLTVADVLHLVDRHCENTS